MNYEQRMERLIAELQEVIKKHLEELEAAEDEIFDVDEVMGRIEAEMGKPSEPVIYPKNKKGDILKAIR